MPSSIPRFDNTDPKRPDTVRTFKLKPQSDVLTSISTGGGMALSAAAMFTRIPALAFGAFFLSIMALINESDIPSANASTSSPWTGLIMSLTSLGNVFMTKLVNPALVAPVPAATVPT